MIATPRTVVNDYTAFRAFDVLAPWIAELPRSLHERRSGYLSAALDERYLIAVAGAGGCLGSLVNEYEGIFLDPSTTPADGDLVDVLWRTSASSVRHAGSSS